MNSLQNASVRSDLLPVTVFRNPTVLVVAVTAGWDETKTLTGKVLEFEGLTFTYTGWNSDRNEVYFRPSTNVAQVR